jgi:hypothetical protein
MDELIAKLRTRLRFDGDTEDDMLEYHLRLAIDTVNDRRQYEPDENDATDLFEDKYEYIIIEMAVCTYNKMGAEGQLYHGENGVNRTYEAGLYPSSLLKLVVPRSRS